MKRTLKKKFTLSKRKRLLKRHKLTEKEYKVLKGNAVRKFREKSINIGEDFEVQIYRKFRVKKGKHYVNKMFEITPKDFVPNKEYKIYVKHKSTRQRRLLG